MEDTYTDTNAAGDGDPRIAIVTGTSRGIGLALAQRLLFIGYEVHGFGRDEADELRVHEAYRHYGCDLSDLDDTRRTIGDWSSDNRAVRRIDAVFLNAGQFGSAIARISDTPMEELETLQRLNCFSSKVILDALLGQGIALDLCAVSSSIAGQRMRAGNGGYALSKATLNAMMELYALEHPDTFFAVLGLCVVDTHLARKIGTLPLSNAPIFEAQRKLRERARQNGYAVTADERVDHLVSLLLPQPDTRLRSGSFVEIRALLGRPTGRFAAAAQQVRNSFRRLSI